jgi:hypothetical protein
MRDYNDRSAYPHPEDFKVMRPEYTELEDDMWQASITVAPFRVTGKSATKAGARRAALYEADKTYRNYHPTYRVASPYPEDFVDREGMKWRRVLPGQRDTLGDYIFVDDEGEEDYVDIETMLMWDVRPVEPDAEEEEEAEEEEG